jgi:hypothetical protein
MALTGGMAVVKLNDGEENEDHVLHEPEAVVDAMEGVVSRQKII